MSYHRLTITKHQHLSPWKIEEEMLEYIDALSTNNPIMAVQELSDLYGVIEIQAKSLGVSMENLKTMSDLTKSVFESGKRVEQTLYENITQTALKIGFIDDMAIAFMPNDFIYLFTDKATQYDDDEVVTNVVIEAVKGSFTAVENGYQLVKSPMYLLHKGGHVELHFERNSIIKLKYFDSSSYMNEILGDPEALTYINQVCNSEI